MSPQFELCGRVVTHTARPRFRLIFKPISEAEAGRKGGWEGGDVDWIDQPLLAGMSATDQAAVLARLMREAGDFFAAHVRRDWVQETVIARAAELRLTAYAIAQATGGAVSENHVRCYLEREKSMGSHKLQHVLRVLRLRLAEDGGG